MRKRKILVLLIILLGIFFVPLFAGCQPKNVEIKLIAPKQVSYKINEGSGRQIIYTEENPFATAYVFGVSEINTNPEDFLRYEVKETDVNGKLKNYLDVTDIFLNTKTYYFYAQYVGSGNYLDSDISEVSSITIYHKYETPYLTLNKDANGEPVLSWSRIANADSYYIYATINGQKEYAYSTSDTTWKITNYVNNKIRAGLSSKIEFTVFVETYKNFLRSAESNSVEYDAYLQLSTPENLEISVNGTQKYLKWSPVPNCNNYTIRVNLLTEVVVNSSEFQQTSSKVSYNVTSLIEELGDYEFAVKANQTGNFLGSDYSTTVSYRHTQQLPAPVGVKLIDYGSFVEISWDEPELAVEYLLYFSDVSNGNQLKQFVLNEETGIYTPIIQSCISLTYEQLGISNFNQLKSNSFLVKVRSKGYGYYTTSEMSTEKIALKSDEEVESPVIVDNDGTKTISWSPVSNAKEYNVIITFGRTSEIYTTNQTSFNYSTYITAIGEYKIKCKTITNDNKVSGDSNVIVKHVYEELNAPVITEIIMEDDTLVIHFEDSQNAESYSLYVNGNLVVDNFSAINNNISILDVVDYQENGVLEFSLKANSHDYYNGSEMSERYALNLKLATPVITIENSTLSWQPILLATSYNLILDDVVIDLHDISTSLNLNSYVDENVARQVRIQATNAYLGSSDASSAKYYNHTNKIAGFTDKYFYYGQTYDFYITSQAELGDFLEYVFLNFIESPVSVYIDYNRSSKISNKINAAKSQITGTRNYKISMSMDNEYYGETAITFTHADKSSQSTTKLYNQYSHDMVYAPESTRDQSHKFVSDNYLVSQKVWSTDGLLSAIQHKATPEFMIEGSMAERVYNAAKAVLIDVIDDTMTDYEKALALHDYLVETITYDDWGLDNVDSNTKLGYFHYIESALLGSKLAVCDGYSKTYALLCGMEGIECIVVHGTYNRGGHAWNKIFLDLNEDGQKECYAVDTTFDDLHVKQGTKTTEFLTHQFFMIPDSYFDKRTEDSNVSYPSAVSPEKFYSYYKPYGFSIKIDSTQTLNDFVDFMEENTEHIKLELLVLNSFVDTSNNQVGGINIDLKITYSPNSTYYMVYIHT